jgi:hypothetical protein
VKPVIVERMAKAELRKARDWYDLKQSGLGDELLLEVLDALESIERDNEAGLRYENSRFRFRLLHRFPYVVITKFCPIECA